MLKFLVDGVKALCRMTLKTVWGCTKVVLFACGVLFLTKNIPSYFALIYEKQAKDSVLVVDLQKEFSEECPGPGAAFFRKSLSFYQLIKSLRLAMNNDYIHAIVFYMPECSLGLAQIEELREHMKIIAKKKPVFVFSYGFSHVREYYLASAATKIFMHPLLGVSFSGFGMEQLFYKNFFEKWGIKAHFFRREEYKSGPEPWIRDSFSQPAKEGVLSLMKGLRSLMLEDIQKSRPHMTVDFASILEKSSMEILPAFLLEKKIVDELICFFDVMDTIRTHLNMPKDEELENLSVENFHAGLRKKQKNVDATADFHTQHLAYDNSEVGTVVILGLSGPIERGSDTIMENTIDGARTAKILRKISKIAAVKAVVLRLDTGGGDVMGSELVREGLVQCKKEGKVVVVSMGNCTASGGYWIASAADEIIAEPTTITGSIGVYSGKFQVAGLLEKLTITVDDVSLSKRALINSPYRPYTAEQEKELDDGVGFLYDVFLNLVAYGRNLSRDDVRKLAKGRVWTGMEAKKSGLVDVLGGITTAVGRAKVLAKLPPWAPVEEAGSISSFGDFLGFVFSDVFLQVKKMVIQSVLPKQGIRAEITPPAP